MRTITKRLFVGLIAVAVVAFGALAQAITPQQYATMMLLGAGKAPAGGGGTLTYTLTQTITQANATSFASVAIGTVTSDRTIVVTAQEGSNSLFGCENGGGSSGPAPTATIGGVTMTSVTQAAESTGGQCLYVYYLFAPAGVLNATTATLAFTSFNAGSGWAFTAGTLTGSTTTSVNASNGNAWSGGGTVADPRGVTNDLAGVAVATGGIVLTGWGIDRTGSYTANSSNTTVDGNITSGIGAFVAAHGTNGSPNFNGASNFNCNFVIASFKP
jgi:hypothetical protein